MFKNAIVLTGSIATGKSTVASILKLFGYSIIDADSIAHKILDENVDFVRKTFGEEYIKDNKVDRKALGKLIFNDKSQKEKLEKFIHPLIKQNILKECEKLEKYNVTYFVDIPLYFERGVYKDYFDKVLVVYTPRDIQIQRLAKRNNISLEEAEKLVSLQMDIEDKKKQADFVIDNSKDLKHLQNEIDKFLKEIK